MQSKLTLRLEDKLIRRAKKYAKQRGKSVSQMVADYFSALQKKSIQEEDVLAPVTRSLKGVLKGGAIKESDYRKHLEKKYL